MCIKTLVEIQERIENIKTLEELEELEELEAAGIIEGIMYKDNFTPLIDALIIDDDTVFDM